jgi:hypothetical protein
MSLIEFPKQRPEILFERMQEWMARHHSAKMRPILWMRHQTGLTRIVENVEA